MDTNQNEVAVIAKEKFTELKRRTFALTQNVEKLVKTFGIPETAVNVLSIKDQFRSLFRFYLELENPIEEEEGLPPLPPLGEAPVDSLEEKLNGIVGEFEGLMCWKIQGLEREMNLLQDPGIVLHVEMTEDKQVCQFVFTMTEGPEIPQFPIDSTPILAAWDATTLNCVGTWLVGGRVKYHYELSEQACDMWGEIPDHFFLANYPSDDSRWDSTCEDYFDALGISLDAPNFHELRRQAVLDHQERYMVQEK